MNENKEQRVADQTDDSPGRSGWIPGIADFFVLGVAFAVVALENFKDKGNPRSSSVPPDSPRSRIDDVEEEQGPSGQEFGRWDRFEIQTFLGKKLYAAAEDFFIKVSPESNFPRQESARLLAGIVQRFLGLSSFAIVMTSLPILMLIWQNQLMETQNEAIREQLANQLHQAKQEAQDRTLGRRTQLLSLIHEREQCAAQSVQSSHSSEACPPQAPIYLREYAVKALTKINDEQPLSLKGARLVRADLRKLQGPGAVLTYADFSYAYLNDGNFLGADFSQSTLARADLTGACLYKAQLLGTDLTAAKITYADLSNAELVEATLAGAQLHGARLINLPTASNADFSGADLSETDFSNADLTSADLRGAILKSATLSNTDLSNAKLGGVDISKTDLSSVNGLTQEQLTSTCGDSSTVIPESLEKPAHWDDQNAVDGCKWVYSLSSEKTAEYLDEKSSPQKPCSSV